MKRCWRLLIAVAASFLALALAISALLFRHPLLLSFCLGVLASGAAATLMVMFQGAQGSWFAWIYRIYESTVVEALDGAPGVFFVRRNIEFDGFDIDCLVVAKAGVFAFEVKTQTFLVPRQTIDESAKTRWCRQAKKEAVAVQKFLAPIIHASS